MRFAIRGTGDPAGLGYAYESVAALIGNDLANAGDLLRDRDRYLRSAAGSKLKIAADLANASEFALLLIEPYRTGPSTTMPSPSDEWSVGIEEQLARIVGLHGGDIRSSTDRYYVCQFVHITEALRSGLAMQERLAVNPIRYQGETATARMGLHGIRSGNAIPPTSLRDGIRTISLLLGNAKAGQLIVSEVVRERCANETSWVRFKPAGTIEIDEDLGDPFLQTYEAIGVKRVQLNPQELEQLFEQDPASRSAGGFQNFLVKLQEKTNRSTGELELTISDLERIARLAFDYRQGGWQNQLRRIFGRVLGETLGRDV